MSMHLSVTSLLFFLLISTSTISQKNDFDAVLLSLEFDNFYTSKPRTRNEILINYSDSLVYYRKRADQKFKRSNLPINTFFKDSINYDNLENLITDYEKFGCRFRSKASIKISIIKGKTFQNYARTYEFGSVIRCADKSDFLILTNIWKVYGTMMDQIFD